MNLTTREKDKLLISMAAMVARRRLERGVKLNHPEAIALISDFVVEGARDGRTVADLMEAGAHVVTRACTRARGGYWALIAERGYTPYAPKARLKRGARADYEPPNGYYLDEWL